MKKKLFNSIIILALMFGHFAGIFPSKSTHAETIPIFIKAINPGYTVDGQGNVGEMIELARPSSDSRTSLAGLSIGYTNSNGNFSTLFEFPDGSFMTGENLILRLASSPDSSLSSATYTKTIAMKGELDLRMGDEVIDRVCWTSKEDCAKEFKSASPTTLVRNLETNTFEHQTDYTPNFDPKNYDLEIIDEGYGEASAPKQCNGLAFSEILTYYETSKSEQFIEFYNPTPEQILLSGCQIKYKNKTYPLSGIIGPEEYLAYFPTDFNLTKNPNTQNTIEIIDTDGTIVDTLIYYNGQRKGTSFIQVGFDANGAEIWQITYAPTPGAANNYQEYKTCEAGKIINEETGNCVKATSVTEKVCAAGQYLNILTGRCKKYTTTSETVCKEGYYYNESTGRCRKIVENDGADYSLTPDTTEETGASFIGLFAVLGVATAGLIYLIYEFRHEIKKFFQRIFKRR